ncbi:hypothetical protein TKK_0008058 [Trichogramma kaykai]
MLSDTLSLGERTMEPAERHSSTNNRPRQQMLDTTTGQKSKLEPGFDLMQPTNVTSPVGKTAYLTCRVHNLGDKTLKGLAEAILQLWETIIINPIKQSGISQKEIYSLLLE